MFSSGPGSQDVRTSSGNVSGNVDVDTLVKSVTNDMLALENSGQWLLSCYGPFKEKAIFPGFEDYSFEEIRFGFYEAMKNGDLEQYVSIIFKINIYLFVIFGYFKNKLFRKHYTMKMFVYIQQKILRGGSQLIINILFISWCSQM